jgi:hypothetical protein
MNEGTAIVIAAILSPVLTLFISELFRYLRSRAEKEDRFFYKVYPKRLELYEDIIRETNYLADTEIPSRCSSADELSDFYKEKCDALSALGNRCCLYGSNRAAGVIASLVTLQAEAVKIVMGFGNPLDAGQKHDLIGALAPGLTAIKLKLTKSIVEESGAYIVNKKISKFLRYPQKRQRVSKNTSQDNNSVSGQIPD